MYFNKFCYFINVLGNKCKLSEKALNSWYFLESINQSLKKIKRAGRLISLPFFHREMH